MSIQDLQCQNRCQFYPNTPESVSSGSSYSWVPPHGTTDAGQRQCDAGGSTCCSPTAVASSSSGYYENQQVAGGQMERFNEAGE